jgi:hypothetical protein
MENAGLQGGGGERKATSAAKHLIAGFYMGEEKLNCIPVFPLSCSACFRM